MMSGEGNGNRRTVPAVHLQKFSVAYEYPVCFTTDVFAPDNAAFVEAVARREPSRRHKIFVVLERTVGDAWPALAGDIVRYAERHADRLELVQEPLVIEGGEEVKNDAAWISFVQSRLNALKMDRQSFVVIIGGGALQDAVGYAVSTVHRGLRQVRLPTTVQGQNDSGVGVKNGVNGFSKKNFFGTFAPPFAILNDARFLESLGRRDRVAGMAEAVKVALIRDAAFFEWLEQNAGGLAACEPAPMEYLVRRGAELHLRHIATSGDPFEFGSARPLDFGHWAGHRLEILSDNRLRHGEAVSLGMAMDSIYSAEVGMLDAGSLERILVLLEGLGLPLWDETMAHASRGGRLLVLDGLSEFREHLGGDLTVTLLEGIGRGVEVHEIREEVVVRSIDRLRLRGAKP